MANTATVPEIQLPGWPREQMQPVVRLEYDRAYPEGSPLRVEAHSMLPSRPFFGVDPWPPMRDALLDTLDFLAEVADDLNTRGLHCLEVSVQHTTGPLPKGATEQGWQYHATVLAVPMRVALAQRKAFDEAQAKAAEGEPALAK